MLNPLVSRFRVVCQSNDEDQQLAESPYLGKGRFKETLLARQRRQKGHGSTASDSPDGSDSGGQGHQGEYIDPEVRAQLEQDIDTANNDLQEKRQAIDEGIG